MTHQIRDIRAESDYYTATDQKMEQAIESCHHLHRTRAGAIRCCDRLKFSEVNGVGNDGNIEPIGSGYVICVRPFYSIED